MPKILLKFTDPEGTPRTISDLALPFVIGRHSENALTIADPRLSRQHVKIFSEGSDILVEDLGSSNGTSISGRKITAPTILRDGDELDLGGFPVAVEITPDAVPASSPVAAPAKPTTTASPAAAAAASTPKPADKGSSGIPMWAFLLAPVAALFLILVAGGAIYMITRGPKPDNDVIAETDDDPISDTRADKTPKNDPSGSDGDNSGPTTSGDTPSTGNGQNSTDAPTPAPTVQASTARVEKYGSIFLRKIARNEPRAFLTAEQTKIVDQRTSQLNGSSALAANIDAARKSASQIREIAAAKNIKPLFLATAAIAKLGNTKGDVLGTARSMGDVFDKLAIQIGNEFADDCLLMVAAYDQGAAGDTMKMRNMLQDLATKFPQSARDIRTIWFLQKQDKISAAEYSQALNFLAVGTITQNPKEFGVNTEALDI